MRTNRQVAETDLSPNRLATEMEYMLPIEREEALSTYLDATHAAGLVVRMERARRALQWLRTGQWDTTGDGDRDNPMTYRAATARRPVSCS